jgi:hypothetical protein
MNTFELAEPPRYVEYYVAVQQLKFTRSLRLNSKVQ